MNKRTKNYTEIIDTLSNMSKKDWKDAVRIVKQYRKAHKMLEKAMNRQEREFMLPNKSKETSLGELNYELQ